MRNRTFIFILLVLTASVRQALADAGPVEPGPENGGLRLRLSITDRSVSGEKGYEVQIDLINVTNQPVTLRAGWRQEEDTGDLKDYLAAATSIETYPAIAPWDGQVMMGNRRSPQPEYVLKPGEALTLNWRTNGRHLKNKVTDPLSVQNPELVMPGLYSVHAIMRLPATRIFPVEGPTRNQSPSTGTGSKDDRRALIARAASESGVDDQLLLRSNEQLVSVGNSRQVPKHTFGELWAADPSTKMARLSLGSLHKIELGDQFEIRTGMSEFWKLTVTRLEAASSEGTLEPMRQVGPNQTNGDPRLPERGMNATLILPK